MIFLAFLEAKRFGITSNKLLIAKHGTNSSSRDFLPQAGLGVEMVMD
jgi:hypothetical protein